MHKIAIFSDIHGLLEPTIAILEDIKKRGITEIYSLGDNISVGPNPSEVIDILYENGVISLAGNAEEYVRLGISPFQVYFTYPKIQSQMWTEEQLKDAQKELISKYPHSIDLNLGGKRIGLCHFANDVRFDYMENGTYAYQSKRDYCGHGYEQFYLTNDLIQKRELEKEISKYGEANPTMLGISSALRDPLFGGKKVDEYDTVIQGHVHFKIYEENAGQKFFCIRAAGMAYQDDPVDKASYIILTETATGYDMEEVLVSFDRDKMLYSILNSTSPDTTIRRFVDMSDKEISRIRKRGF